MTVRSKNVKQCTEEGGRLKEKRSGRTGKREKEEVNEERYLPTQTECDRVSY